LARDAESCGFGDRLYSVGDTQLPEDRGDVMGDGLFGHEQPAGDFGVAQSVAGMTVRIERISMGGRPAIRLSSRDCSLVDETQVFRGTPPNGAFANGNPRVITTQWLSDSARAVA
jgi:hypothetical protein